MNGSDDDLRQEVALFRSFSSGLIRPQVDSLHGLSVIRDGAIDPIARVNCRRGRVVAFDLRQVLLPSDRQAQRPHPIDDEDDIGPQRVGERDTNRRSRRARSRIARTCRFALLLLEIGIR